MSKKSRKKNAPLLLPSSKRPQVSKTNKVKTGSTRAAAIAEAAPIDAALPVAEVAVVDDVFATPLKRRRVSSRPPKSTSDRAPRSSARPQLDAVIAAERTPTTGEPASDIASAVVFGREAEVESTSEPVRQRRTITPPRPVLSLVGQDEDEDDISIPPAAELDEGFFADGERHSRESLDGVSDSWHDVDAPDPRVLHSRSAAGQARRAKLARYVQWSLACAALLCFIAGVRGTFSGLKSPEVAERAALAASPAALQAPIVHEEAVIPRAAEPTEPSAAAVAEVPPPPTVAEVAAAIEPVPAVVVDARAEKRAAKTALERGANKLAIEAAEKSVIADATDAEAWLLLGAAYQETGRAKEAREAFRSCAKQAKQGPVSECRALLSSAN